MVRAGVIERLDSQTVAGKKQLASNAVPQGNREHAVQALDRPIAVFLVQMENRLGVGPSAVAVATRFEPGAQVRMVVDFSVEHAPDIAVLGCHGLPSAGDVDDRKPTMAESDGAFHPIAGAIRPAMGEHVAHAGETSLVHFQSGLERHDADDAAHQRCPPIGLVRKSPHEIRDTLAMVDDHDIIVTEPNALAGIEERQPR